MWMWRSKKKIRRWFFWIFSDEEYESFVLTLINGYKYLNIIMCRLLLWLTKWGGRTSSLLSKPQQRRWLQEGWVPIIGRARESLESAKLVIVMIWRRTSVLFARKKDTERLIVQRSSQRSLNQRWTSHMRMVMILTIWLFTFYHPYWLLFRWIWVKFLYGCYLSRLSQTEVIC